MVKVNGLLFTGDKIYLKQSKKTSRSISAAANQPNLTNNTTNDLSSLNIAHTNINGVRNKLDHVSAELSDYEIICVSETKLNPNFPTSKITINGYRTPIRKDRITDNGGGLAIYTKHNIYTVRRQDLENNNIENIWIEVHTSNNKLLLGLFYRPPDSSAEFWNHFEDSVESAADLNLNMLIVGDFNNDLLSKYYNRKMTRIMQKFDLHHTINEATRFDGNTKSCLDLIMTNHKAIINNTKILPPFHSDHCTVTAEVSFKTYKAQSFKKTMWKFEEANIAGIEEQLDSTDWSFISTNSNINEITQTFEEILMKASNDYVPKITFTVRPNDKPWMNSEIRKEIRKRDRLYHKAKISKSQIHWQNFKNKRNEVIDLIRSAKSNYMKKLQSSLSDPNLKPKAWYKIVNEITKLKNKNNPSPPLRKDNQINIHPFDKAQVLNKHFAEISSIENEPPLPDDPEPPNHRFQSIIISEQDVKDQLHKLNASKPAGPDEIFPKLIKLMSKSLVKPLTMLFNRSLELGSVPNQWKMANISAIFKGKGEEQDPSNYRPISITSCLGKILEKIIFKYLYNYLHENNILTDFQSGFRPKDSTVNQLLEIYHIIISNMDKGKEIKFIFCDVSKAFDKVWHRGLIHKLKKYGLCDGIIEWFSSYLTNRKQRVTIDGFHSTWSDTEAGVPQGSVLGPYLFLLYINDIVENISSNIRLFADDTSLFTVIENADSIKTLNEDIYRITKWSKDWLIILNHVKTSTMTFTWKKDSNLPDVIMNDTVLSDDPNHTHLGLTFTSDARWDEHIRKIYEKAAFKLNVLRMLKYDLDRKSLLRFYISYIRPTLEYADVVWDNISQRNVDLLESIQLDACRIITGLRKGTSHDILYQECGLCSLAERRKQHKLIQFYKILNHDAPNYLQNIVANFNEHQSQYELRNPKLKHPTPKSKTYKDSFFISTTDLWNELPQSLLNATSLYSFKKILKEQIPVPAKYFSYGSRRLNILMCQLRNSKSQLQSDLCHDHLADSAICNNCNAHVPETAQHFFFECSKYEAERYELIHTLIRYPIIYENLAILNANNLLFGLPNMTLKDNEILVDIVTHFIEKTGRFY